MKIIQYASSTKFNHFEIKDLFTNELRECSEEEFDDCVTKFRNLYDMKYAPDNINKQLFYSDGELYAIRERLY